MEYEIDDIDDKAKKHRRILYKALAIASLIALGTLIFILILDLAILPSANQGLGGAVPIWVYFFDFFVVFGCGIVFNKTLKSFQLSKCVSYFRKKELVEKKKKAEQVLEYYKNPNSKEIIEGYAIKERQFLKSIEQYQRQALLIRMKKEYAMTVILPKLKQEYGELLYVQNWGYLDSLISVFQNQRADTIASALAYLDTQRAVMRVAELIEASHKDIAGKINQVFNTVGGLREEVGRLSGSLKEAEKRLAWQMENVCNRIIDNQTGLAEDFKQTIRQEARQIVASNNKLINAQEITNALLREANSNSGEIAQKLGIIKDKLN
ncbi:MAG: hypothetical protein IJA82_01465 [Clostridia bacterium]|nr:hypothetical protein [Clostridia bacterium]